MPATEISLDSQKDVQFLKSNISLATREKLDTHLPPSAVPNIHDDALRKRVEEMLDEFVSRTFEMAGSSLLINGMKPSLSSAIDQQDMEPFDADLLARVQTLHREIEEKTLEVTSLRRSTPAQTAALFQQSCSLPEAVRGPDSGATLGRVEAGVRVEREGEVKETFTKGMKLLKDLKKGVPATSAKLERSREVVAHVYS